MKRRTKIEVNVRERKFRRALSINYSFTTVDVWVMVDTVMVIGKFRYSLWS